VTTSVLIERSITHAAWQACNDCAATAVIACTLSGRTARSMARFRPTSLLLGMSPNPRTARQLALSWGVVPMLVGTYSTTDEMVWCVVEAATGSGLLAKGDLVAVLAGAPDSIDHTTDVLRIVRLA
jgi:pyruvate kinase